MSTPTPPTDFQSWLDYAIATMDARGAHLDRIFSEDDIPSQDDIRAAAQEELNHLKRKTVMPWISMLENWQIALSKLLAYFGRTDTVHTILLVLGSHFGASAPDWMEISTCVTKRRWFSPNETRRLSLIPHRTITHTLSLWLLGTLYSAYRLFVGAHESVDLLFFGFFASALTHILLDIRTPMGIPLLPFGRRYRVHEFRLKLARGVEARDGW